MASRLPLLLNPANLLLWSADLVRTVESYITTNDLTKQTVGSIVRLPVYTVATLPSAAPAGQMIYVSDETGGAVVAFSDATNWRRVTDRAIVA